MTSALRLLVLALALALCAGCGGDAAPRAQPRDERGCPAPGDAGAAVDYVDFVRFDGRTYLAPSLPRPITVPKAELGIPVATVTCELSGSGAGPDRKTRDGDAAFLAKGTVVYAIRGYGPTFRVAAHRDGEYRVYEVDAAPDARTGADLLDIRGKVLRIELLDGDTGTHTLGVIDDPARVDALVNGVLAARVDQDRVPTVDPLFVRFDLADGTAVQRAWFPADALLQRGILLPPAFGAALRPLAG